MKYSLVFIALLFAIAGCGTTQKRPEPGVFEELEFRVDSLRLGENAEVGGISLRVPKDWVLIDDETMTKLTDVAKRDTSQMALAPVKAYRRAGGGPMLLISKFPKAIDLGAGFIPWAGEVAKVYRVQRPDILVQEQWMSLGGVEALQLISRSPQLVHLKVILHADEPVSLDYTVPLNKWDEEVHSVESSLGSIRKVYK